MITPRDIVLHIAEYLPRISDLFCDTLDIDTAVISGNYTITVTTSTAHGLVPGSPIIFTGGKTQNVISTAEDDVPDETVLIEFSDVHDFTTPNTAIGTEPLLCTGFNEAEWNTTLEIVDVPTDQSVIVNYPPGATGPPTFTTAIGYEERPLSIFGTQSVAAVPSTTQFTVLLDSTSVPGLPNGAILNATATTGIRCAAVDSVDRADKIYAKQSGNKLWLFVIMTDLDISKDRHTYNDGIASFSSQDTMRLRALQNFSTVVYFRSADKISGATAQELAYGTIFLDLLQVLYGFSGFTKDTDASEFATVVAGHGAGTSNVAYYTEVYDWQCPVDISFDNGFNFYEDVAFRHLDGSFGMFTTDNLEQLTLAFDIDP